MGKQPVWVWVLLPIVLITTAYALWPVYTDQGHHCPPKTRCISNVKQLALGISMYATDSDGKMPFRDTWMDATGPYMKNADLLHCSEVKDPDLYGYALNAGVVKDGVSNPAGMPLVYDSVNLARNASDLFTSLPQAGRHYGMNVIGYLDGHAKAVAAPKAPSK